LRYHPARHGKNAAFRLAVAYLAGIFWVHYAPLCLVGVDEQRNGLPRNGLTTFFL